MSVRAVGIVPTIDRARTAFDPRTNRYRGNEMFRRSRRFYVCPASRIRRAMHAIYDWYDSGTFRWSNRWLYWNSYEHIQFWLNRPYNPASIVTVWNDTHPEGRELNGPRCYDEQYAVLMTDISAVTFKIYYKRYHVADLFSLSYMVAVFDGPCLHEVLKQSFRAVRKTLHAYDYVEPVVLRAIVSRDDPDFTRVSHAWCIHRSDFQIRGTRAVARDVDFSYELPMIEPDTYAVFLPIEGQTFPTDWRDHDLIRTNLKRLLLLLEVDRERSE